MKTGASSLNPYAASYIPLFKRGGAQVVKEFSSAHELNRGNETVGFGRQPNNALLQGQGQNSSHIHGHGVIAFQTNVFSKRIGHPSGEFFTLSSQYPNQIHEKSNFDEDMDLAYLQMTFPGISNESLCGVYSANKHDLDASVDMLNQLEIYPDDSSDKLPDTLDIGDVPESGPVGGVKVKKATVGGGASTSGSAHLSSPS